MSGEVAVRIVAGIVGLVVVVLALESAVITLVLPRGGNTRTAHLATRLTRAALTATARRTRPRRRERALALLAPIALLLMPIAWLLQVWLAYAALYVAAGVGDVWDALVLSGSSLLTLGFATADGIVVHLLIFSEATLGLGIVTLLIAYLPTMYTAFSERETQVALLAVRAGTPPRADEMLWRYKRIGNEHELGGAMLEWEEWFAQLSETHTTLTTLPLFRSSDPAQSWITAAGAVLDAASLLHSTVEDGPRAPAALCIRSGFLALRAIADEWALPYDPDPAPDDPIAITRAEYDEVYDRLAEAGLDLVEREQAWRDFAGWRVNYDTPLLALAEMIEAPSAPWTSDRPPLTGMSRMGRSSSMRR
ncbi:hypothetical protein [Salsipaludibacter albus]|uniref:hypothetical protein n=1 Tax=Salsipaludibacter albus TaxID=2849650 RepID=UPI001EE477CF|nr:hypothetical protein [Salsipaludibacter albus]MBY5160920.1 hypothetical protein [Salsipaludibacter albus]